MKKIKCPVCGTGFRPEKKDLYFAVKKSKDGLAAAFAREPDITYECYDCPSCGAQNITQERYEKEPCGISGMMEDGGSYSFPEEEMPVLPVDELPCETGVPTVLDAGAKLPSRAHPDDAGLDLYSREDALIPSHGAYVFDTGVHMAIPHGYDGKITSKSGLCMRHDIVSEAGEIDSNYRGSIRVKLRNHGDKPYIVHSGDKIAQIVIRPVSLAVCRRVDTLDETDRGTGAFGSTGR